MGRPPKKKKDIERAALELFAEHGIDGTSIRMIAERAAVTEGALYRHHASKDDLVMALFRQYYEGFGEMLAGTAAAGGSFDERILRMVRGFLEAYDADPLGFRFLLLVQHALLEKARDMRTSPVPVLMKVIADAVDRGEIPAQDEVLSAHMVLGGVMHIAVGHRYGRFESPLALRAPEVARAALRVLKSPAAMNG